MKNDVSYERPLVSTIKYWSMWAERAHPASGVAHEHLVRAMPDGAQLKMSSSITEKKKSSPFIRSIHRHPACGFAFSLLEGLYSTDFSRY